MKHNHSILGRVSVSTCRTRTRSRQISHTPIYMSLIILFEIKINKTRNWYPQNLNPANSSWGILTLIPAKFNVELHRKGIQMGGGATAETSPPHEHPYAVIFTLWGLVITRHSKSWFTHFKKKKKEILHTWNLESAYQLFKKKIYCHDHHVKTHRQILNIPPKISRIWIVLVAKHLLYAAIMAC